MPRKIYGVTAHEKTSLTGGHSRLTVTAEIETFNENDQISLFEAVPQGINPDILILAAQVDQVGVGADVLGYTTVTFVRPITAHQYEQVTVTTEGHSSTVSVRNILS